MSKLNDVYNNICTVMDAKEHYTKKEIKEMSQEFIYDMNDKNKESRNKYIDVLKEQIENIRPVEKDGIYFEFEKEIENIIEHINNYSLKGRKHMWEITDEQLDAIVVFMDDETRERVHWELAPCSSTRFLKRYLELNRDIEELLESEFGISVWDLFYGEMTSDEFENCKC